MPDPTSMTSLYAWLVAGVAALVLGVIGLLNRGRPKASARPWLGPLLFAASAAVVAGVALAAGATAAAFPPALLVLLGLGLALFRTGLPRAASAAVLGGLARPRVQSLLLVVTGVALLSWQSWALSSHLEQDLADTDRHLSTLDAPSLEAFAALTSRTDSGTPVPLWQLAAGSASDGERELEFLRRSSYDVKLIQTDGPDPRYNCHGWVFTGGRAWVRGESVEAILRDHHYQPVDRPSPGDVAVYRNHASEVMHTAVVRGFAADGSPLLESKWGKLGRYIHLSSEHVYRGHACTYYTTPRGGHVLQTAKAE